jgi:formylglycine-generating enzyme required for sulfatase activity
MGRNPSQFAACGESCPVESVSWLDVQDFLLELNSKDSNERFRLPTEAEWEFVCRSGFDSRYTDGIDTLSPEIANYNPEIPFEGDSTSGFREGPVPVGSFPGNTWGLHDLHGNVWEWMQDEYCPYPDGAVVDPFGECGSDTIPIRGGSWLFSANAARCGRRYTHARTDSGYSLGFRVVREIRP